MTRYNVMLATAALFGATPPASIGGDPAKRPEREPNLDAANRAQTQRGGGYYSLLIRANPSHDRPLPAYDGGQRTTPAPKGKRLTRAQRKALKARGGR